MRARTGTMTTAGWLCPRALGGQGGAASAMFVCWRADRLLVCVSSWNGARRLGHGQIEQVVFRNIHAQTTYQHESSLSGFDAVHKVRVRRLRIDGHVAFLGAGDALAVHEHVLQAHVAHPDHEEQGRQLPHRVTCFALARHLAGARRFGGQSRQQRTPPLAGSGLEIVFASVAPPLTHCQGGIPARGESPHCTSLR